MTKYYELNVYKNTEANRLFSLDFFYTVPTREYWEGATITPADNEIRTIEEVQNLLETIVLDYGQEIWITPHAFDGKIFPIELGYKYREQDDPTKEREVWLDLGTNGIWPIPLKELVQYEIDHFN